MSLSALRFSAAWLEAAALAAQITDHHVKAFGHALHVWNVTDRTDETTGAAMVLLMTDARQAERVRPVGVTVMPTAMEGDLLIDTVHGHPGMYRFMSAAQDDAFDTRFVAIFGATLALVFELCDALRMACARTAEANADVLAWPAQLDALPRVLEPALPCPIVADLVFVLGPTQLGVYAVVPDAGWVARLIVPKVPTV